MLTFKSITLLRTLYIVSQVGRLVTCSHGVASRLRRYRDNHRCILSFVPFDWYIDVCWKRIVGWCHWSRIQVTTIVSPHINTFMPHIPYHTTPHHTTPHHTTPHHTTPHHTTPHHTTPHHTTPHHTIPLLTDHLTSKEACPTILIHKSEIKVH